MTKSKCRQLMHQMQIGDSDADNVGRIQGTNVQNAQHQQALQLYVSSNKTVIGNVGMNGIANTITICVTANLMVKTY